MTNDRQELSGRVLVVDDDAGSRKLLRITLERHGYEVWEAEDGEEALARVHDQAPDVILLDVMMPKIDGFEVCRRIKGEARTSHIPVLLVTMLSDRQHRLTGIKAGANDFLSQPVDMDETLLRVRNALETKRLFDASLSFRQDLERVVAERTRDLHAALEEVKASQGQIIQQEKLATIGQLAAGVAHEINNPTGFIATNLASLAKYVDRVHEYLRAVAEATPALEAEKRAGLAALAKRLKIDFIIDDASDLIRESLEGTERIKKIVQGLKSFSRRDDATPTPADINECLEAALSMVWNELKYKATVVKEYGALPKTQCYPQQLGQVFMNLLVNAGHAIDKGGTITIRTLAEDEAIVVRVSDTGCGIPAENLTRIFEPFFTTKEAGKGTGLGMSIAKEIVGKHHGDITVASTVGQGTTFTIRLPIVP